MAAHLDFKTIQGDLFADYADPYLTSQIIAYIGNKRKLLPLLQKALIAIFGEIPRGGLFLDLFAGSGVVSRFAKVLGFRVVSNDWEPYAYIINSAYILIGKSKVERLFDGEGGLAAALARFNTLPEPGPEDRYISEYYSTRSDDINQSNYRTERLFYTKANGLAIDKIRSGIDREYPDSGDPDILKKRNLLIALLVYEAATHTNTSGVFKACHKGFGGLGKDALYRICLDISLPYPVLFDSGFDHRVHMEDAEAVASRSEYRDAEVVYLDPPYNQHQYGSNYHLLNTIALWDKPHVPLVTNGKGRLTEKSGIRKDWIRTRSDYCYRDKACGIFESLLNAVSARNILISYSTDGIIPFSELIRMCEKKGRVSIETDEYLTYRGGKQSNSREKSNIEFVLTIRPGLKNNAPGREKVLDTIRRKKLVLLLKKRHSYARLRERFSLSAKKHSVTFVDNGNPVVFRSPYFLELHPVADLARDKPILDLISALEYTVCTSKEEELDELLHRCIMFPGSRAIAIEIPYVLKMLAHKKNKQIFYAYYEKAMKLADTSAFLSDALCEKLKAVLDLAEKRFSS
jgi:adenine-specific DNA-methyltransferase